MLAGRLHGQCTTCVEQCLDSSVCYPGYAFPVDYCAYLGGCPAGQTANGGCCCDPSPILLDLSGKGIRLTSADNGVLFDIGGDGRLDQIAWTHAESDDAFLVLDRNGNGIIDNGEELFGNFTPQPFPISGPRNGFLALAVFDEPSEGGNRDGRIDPTDTVFAALRLWQDRNHNGVSEVGELSTLDAHGIISLSLDYKESKRTDRHGNRFSYRAKVETTRSSETGKWAWDVYLRTSNNLHQTSMATRK